MLYQRTHKRVTVLGVCGCVSVSVCLSVRAISAIQHNKMGHHKNQHPMGKILVTAIFPVPFC